MMRVAIIALILATAALGLGSFATFTALDNSETTLVTAEATWSAAECERAETSLGVFNRACRTEGNCNAYNDMIKAIAENCE